MITQGLCAICYATTGREVEPTYKTGWTRGAKVELCEEHKNYFQNCKTREEFYDLVRDLENASFNRISPNCRPQLI